MQIGIGVHWISPQFLVTFDDANNAFFLRRIGLFEAGLWSSAVPPRQKIRLPATADNRRAAILRCTDLVLCPTLNPIRPPFGKNRWILSHKIAS